MDSVAFRNFGINFLKCYILVCYLVKINWNLIKIFRVGGVEMAVFAAGLAALVLGIIGIFALWGEFLLILKGTVPVMLILGGALAAYLGFEEIRDKGTEDSFEDNSADLKQEVESLKEELKGLKGDKEEE